MRHKKQKKTGKSRKMKPKNYLQLTFGKHLLAKELKCGNWQHTEVFVMCQNNNTKPFIVQTGKTKPDLNITIVDADSLKPLDPKVK